MASSTFTAKDALDYATRFISNADMDRMLPRILDDVHRMFWMAAPWRWTLGAFPNIALAASTQDYTVSVPTDFLFLQEAKILGAATPRPLHCAAYLPSVGSSFPGQPSQIAIQGTTARILPVPGTISGNSLQVVSLYKKQAPKIDRSTMGTAGYTQIPDEFYWAFQEGVLWRAMAWAQDPRAGGVTVAGDNVQYTGQRAAFQDAIKQCSDTEKLNRVDSQEDQR